MLSYNIMPRKNNFKKNSDEKLGGQVFSFEINPPLFQLLFYKFLMSINYQLAI